MAIILWLVVEAVLDPQAVLQRHSILVVQVDQDTLGHLLVIHMRVAVAAG
jgi:hypothetical protein